MMLKVGIIYQSEFGGTNVLLGKLSHWMSCNNIDVIDIEEAKKNKILLDYIILPTSEISSIFPYLLQGLKFKDYIIWSMGHGAFRASFINERMIKKSKIIGVAFRVIIFVVDLFLRKILETKRIIFTDYVGLSHDVGNIGSYEKYQGLVFPIVVERSNLIHQKKMPLRFGWVGRIDNDFKVGPLISLLQDLNRLHREGVIYVNQFSIIGDGNAMELVKDEIKTLSFSIELLGIIPNNKLSGEINNKIDVLFAMGTSVLEGAKITLPSIIVNPFSLGASEQSGYRWVYDSIGYSLGEFSLGDVYPIQRKAKLDIILNELVQFGYDYHSNKSHKYVESFYPETVFEALSQLINGKRHRVGYAEQLLFFSSFTFQATKTLMKRLKKKESNHDYE